MQQRSDKRGNLFFIGSFLLLITIGTLMLMISSWAYTKIEPTTAFKTIVRENLPRYTKGALSLPDTIFTATSAVCVTGLSVVDVADFNLSGQLLLLILMQLGGIGIMSLSALILLLFGGGLSFSDSLLVSNLNEKFSLRGTESLIRTITRYTLICEGIGFVVILVGFLPAIFCEPSFGREWWICLGNSSWNALFLSVSSFCNAGFAPFRDSLITQNGWIRFGCGIMIVLGGLGVYVVYDLWQVFQKRQRALRLHSKIVIHSTWILLAGGAVLFFLFGFKSDKWHIVLGESLFMSATCRTAGFTCVDLAGLPDVSLALCIVLMLVGGSPGSTAGGIKTSTFAVAVVAICNTLKGNQETRIFRRRIPNGVVLRAFTIIVIFSLLAGGGAVALQLCSPEVGITRNVFETVSALCTVGLSVGKTTAEQTVYGKAVLVALMFLGRVGPLTFLLFLLKRETASQLKYPEERVIIG